MKARDKLKIGAKIMTSKLTARPRPFFVQYSLLNACNTTCVYCNCPSREDPRISTADHLHVLGEFARLGAVRIKFLGGEPLLLRDIGLLAERVSELGMRSAMVTNGFLVAEKLDVVRKLDELVISIDGDEIAHDRQRGKGSWQKVMRAIDICVQEKVDFFLSAVVTKESAGEIDWLLQLASRLGVMVNFQITQVNEEMYGLAAREWMPAPEEIRIIIARIIVVKER